MNKIWIAPALLTAFYIPLSLAKNSPLDGAQLAMFVKLNFSSDRCAEPKCCQANYNGCENEACNDRDCD